MINMFGLMIRRIPKEIKKLPHYVQRSDYWNKKIWAVELGIVNEGDGWCYGDLWSIIHNTHSYQEDSGDYDKYYYYTSPLQLLKLYKVFRWQNVVWAAYMLKKYKCEVYVYEANI